MIQGEIQRKTEEKVRGALEQSKEVILQSASEHGQGLYRTLRHDLDMQVHLNLMPDDKIAEHKGL